MQALQEFQRQRPDLVVLDWVLPELNGLEVLRRIRKVSAAPVLMLTARGDPTDRVLGLEVGADDYLVKPFNLPELVARVRALLRRAALIREMLATDPGPAPGSDPLRQAGAGPPGPLLYLEWGTPRADRDRVRTAIAFVEPPGPDVQPHLPGRDHLEILLYRRRPGGG